MKRMLALVLVLVLCAACIPAMAEGTQTYTHPTQGYSFVVPADWLCVDKTNVQNYINAMMTGEMVFSGVDAVTLSQVKSQIEMMDLVFFIKTSNNTVTVRSADLGIALTMEQFLANVVPQLNQSVLNAIPGTQFANTGSLAAYGNKTFVITTAYYGIMNDVVAVDVLYYLEGTTMYELTITSRDTGNALERETFYEDVMQMVLSFATKAEKPATGLGEYVSFADNYQKYLEEALADEETADVETADVETADAEMAEFKTYTYPTQGYSVIVPAEWIAVDRTNIQSRIDAAAAGQIYVPNVNVQQLMTNMKSQIAANDMVVFVDGNANYVAFAMQNFGQAITYDQYEQQVLPMVMNSYSAKAGYREIIGGERVVYGGKEFIVIEVEFGTGTSKSHILQLAYIDGAILYAVTANVLPLYDQAVIDAFNSAVLEAAATTVSGK